MSSIIQRFITGRPEKREIVTNSGAVSREDFNKLAEVVTNMTKAVEGLIEEVETITSPEKLSAIFNAAIKEAGPAIQASRSRIGRASLVPSDDEPRVNSQGARKPLALPADRASLAPQGD